MGCPPWNKGKRTGLVPRSAFRKGNIPWNKGRTGIKQGFARMSDTERAIASRKISEAQKENWARNPERRKRLGIQSRQRWNSPTRFMMITKGSKTKKAKMRNPEFKEKELQRLTTAQHKTPNSLEKKAMDIIAKYGLPYRYVGNGQIWINGRCPDFINTDGKKQVIEVFGLYWHSPLLNPYIDNRSSEYKTKEHYSEYGFNCLIIWENELYHPVKLLRKIKTFSRGQYGSTHNK